MQPDLSPRAATQPALLGRTIPAALAALSILAAALVALQPTPASAWAQHGCRYAGTSPVINFRFMNASVTWDDRYREARDKWNATSVPGTFTLSQRASDPEIEISTGSFAGGWWAQTSWSCVIATGLYNMTFTTARLGVVMFTAAQVEFCPVFWLHYGHDRCSPWRRTRPAL